MSRFPEGVAENVRDHNMGDVETDQLQRDEYKDEYFEATWMPEGTNDANV